MDIVIDKEEKSTEDIVCIDLEEDNKHTAQTEDGDSLLGGWTKERLEELSATLTDTTVAVKVKKEAIDYAQENTSHTAEEEDMSLSALDEESISTTFKNEHISTEATDLPQKAWQQTQDELEQNVSKRKSSIIQQQKEPKRLHVSTDEDTGHMPHTCTEADNTQEPKSIEKIVDDTDKPNASKQKTNLQQVTEPSDSDLEWEQIARDIDQFEKRLQNKHKLGNEQKAKPTYTKAKKVHFRPTVQVVTTAVVDQTAQMKARGLELL